MNIKFIISNENEKIKQEIRTTNRTRRIQVHKLKVFAFNLSKCTHFPSIEYGSSSLFRLEYFWLSGPEIHFEKLFIHNTYHSIFSQPFRSETLKLIFKTWITGTFQDNNIKNKRKIHLHLPILLVGKNVSQNVASFICVFLQNLNKTNNITFYYFSFFVGIFVFFPLYLEDTPKIRILFSHTIAHFQRVLCKYKNKILERQRIQSTFIMSNKYDSWRIF